MAGKTSTSGVVGGATAREDMCHVYVLTDGR